MENFKISHNKKIKESQLKIKKISNLISNSDLLENFSYKTFMPVI